MLINLRIEVHFFRLHWEMKGHWSSVNLVKYEALLKDFTCDRRPFISKCKRTKVYFNPYINAKAMKTPKRSKKSMSTFPSHDQCLSFENICNSFLMLHCRRLPWECKYKELNSIFISITNINTLYLCLILV